MSLGEKILKATDTLEALYFLTQGLDGAGQDAKNVREHYRKLPKQARRELLNVMNTDIRRLRDHYGALAPNHYYRSVRAEIGAAQTALAYIGKLDINHLFFSHYERALRRWPHIKDHALVVFDPQRGMANQVFEMDGQLFHDAQFLLQKVRNIQDDAKSQRELPSSRHRIIHSVMRAVVTELFTFLEAYLNGIAFDCFHKHHDQLSLADHDLLAEWNSDAKRKRFVPFDQKVIPIPCHRCAFSKKRHRVVWVPTGLSNRAKGRDLRDAITHPSAHYEPGSHEQRKITLLAGLILAGLE